MPWALQVCHQTTALLLRRDRIRRCHAEALQGRRQLVASTAAGRASVQRLRLQVSAPPYALLWLHTRHVGSALPAA